MYGKCPCQCPGCESQHTDLCSSLAYVALPARCFSYKKTTYKGLEAHSVKDRTRQANSKERNVPRERSIEKGSERKGIAKRKKYREEKEV